MDNIIDWEADEDNDGDRFCSTEGPSFNLHDCNNTYNDRDNTEDWNNTLSQVSSCYN